MGLNFSLGSAFQPGGGANVHKGVAKSNAGNWLGRVSDPMDLFGAQAKLARNTVENLQRQALTEQEQAARDAYDYQVKMQQPYYDAGVNALSQLSTPGAIPLSEQYGRDMEQGSRALNRSLAASGQFRSSNAYDKFGQFYNQLGGEEMGRQYNNALAPIKIAQQAMGATSQASDTYGAGMSSAYNNFGQQGAQNALLYGQRRSDSLNNMGQGINSAAQYYASRPVK